MTPKEAAEWVLPAFQLPSWYNSSKSSNNRLNVLPAFQLPSWYNSDEEEGEE